MSLKKRLGAFLLCGVIAFHSVCFYTPPAKAAVLESMLANMCLSTFMTATGISLVPDDPTSERLGQALEGLVDSFIPDYQLEVPDFTKESWYTALAADTVILDTGFVRIGSGAAALLGKFTGWLIDKFGLIGEDGTPVTGPVGIAPSVNPDVLLYNGNELPDIETAWTDKESYPYALYYKLTGVLYVLSEVPYYGKFYSSYGILRPSTNCRMMRFNVRDGKWVAYGSENGNIAPEMIVNANVGNWTDECWSNFDIYDNSTGLVFHEATQPKAAEDWENPVLSVTLPADYEAAPTVDEQYSMVIDTGMTYEDEQSFIDAILAGAAAGNLSPTYTVEQTTPGDVTVPDEGEDTDDEQGGILDWTKKIWQSVVELPQTIVNALADVFVPSAEYMAALPETVTATFDGRTGFLTYPFSVLADFTGRLGDTGSDWIISWPDIEEPFSGGRLISKGEFNVSRFVRSDLTLSNIYSIWMLITKGYLIFLFLDLCHHKYKSVVGDRLE